MSSEIETALTAFAALPCGDLKFPYDPTVTVQYTNDQNFPSTAIFSCPDGYVLSPPAQSTKCVYDYTIDGTAWIEPASPPSCTRE